MEDKNLRVIKIAEIFHDAGLTDMAVNDDDVQVPSYLQHFALPFTY